MADDGFSEFVPSLLPGISCKAILCWVGSSEEPDAVVAVASSLASQSRGRCQVVMGLDSPFHHQQDRQGRRDRFRSKSPLTPEVIGRAEKKLSELYGSGVNTMVLPGHPVAEVRRYARNHNIDLIIMGEQGQRVEHQYGERLADRAPCPVLILLYPKQESKTKSQPSTRSSTAKER
jgi:nucleotide-binding universal stress UspA family protein